MKRNHRTYKHRFLLACTFLFSLFFIQQSCTKIDTAGVPKADPVEKFFTVPAGTEPQVKRIIENLKEQNKLTGFISKMAQEEGYAVWDKALAATKAQVTLNFAGTAAPDTLIYIPLVLENTRHVNSFIYARLNGSITLKLYRGREYQQFGFDSTKGENALSLTKTLIMLDNKVFGAKKFLINDRRLFADSMSLKIKPGTERNVLTLSNISYNAPSGGSDFHFGWLYSTTCTQHEGMIAGPGLAGTDYHWGTWTECETSCIFVMIEDEGGGGYNPGTGSTPDTGGGGSSNPSNYPGNNQCTLIFNGEMPPTCSGGNGEQGPVTVLEGDEPIPVPDLYNPNQADNVILDTSISNNFPCVSKILDTLSAYGTDNLNKKAQVAIKTIFGENTYQTITITADPTLPPDMDAVVDPNLTTHYTVGSDLTTHYNFTMKVNPAMLATATKEYIAATLVHEAMHAYINYLFYEYQYGAVDSNEIKSKFPIFWYRTPPMGIALDPAYQHNQMANSWTGEIKNALNAFTNNEMTAAEKENVYRALSWGGLERESYMYQTLPLNDRFNIQAINIVAKDRFHTGPYTFELLPNHEVSPVFNYTASSLKMKNPCD